MGAKSKMLVYAGAAAFSLLLYGFVLFSTGASRRLATPNLTADAIVVLTGAERRIEAGIELLRQGNGRRLLISGINRRVTPAEVIRIHSASIEAADTRAPDTRVPGTRAGGTGLGPCCIDFGYDAQDTIGNASETRAWASHHRFNRLIVVTSSYHMPRSLNELALALPGVELIAYPVLPRALHDNAWWLNASAIRVLASEYLKLMPSYAKYAAYRLLPREPSLIAPAVKPPARAAVLFP